MITLTYIAKLGFVIQKINVSTHKIDNSALVIYKIVFADFSVQDKFGKIQFLEKTLLLADISIDMILRILFLTLLNTDVLFVEKKLEQKSFITAEALPIIKKVKLINKQEFAIIALDEDVKTFVIYIANLSATLTTLAIQVHPSQQAQFRLLLVDKASISISSKYSDYAEVFLFDLIIKLPKNIDMNEHIIELINRKQAPYRLIYTLSLVELEIMKTYIKTYLKPGFI